MATDRDGLPGERPQQPGQREEPATWEAHDVRRLRSYLRESQAALAARLGTRQQTVSEWETGVSRPRRMSRRLLRLVAEESGYYAAGSAPTDDAASSPGGAA